MSRIVLIIGLLVLLGAGLYLYTTYDYRAGISTAKPDFSVEATLLFTEFEENEDAANAKYLGKILEVTGIARNIEFGSEPGSVTLETNAMLGAVVCELSQAVKMNLQDIREGEEITIKGHCSGKLLDVILVNCIILD
ncbi:MAG: OB-fold putative lipoprotein [Saprospiraceae bacterium]|nr:OB-fold putative lipoprotein [Saprospiraceae bacterium]